MDAEEEYQLFLAALRRIVASGRRGMMAEIARLVGYSSGSMITQIIDSKGKYKNIRPGYRKMREIAAACKYPNYDDFLELGRVPSDGTKPLPPVSTSGTATPEPPPELAEFALKMGAAYTEAEMLEVIEKFRSMLNVLESTIPKKHHKKDKIKFKLHQISDTDLDEMARQLLEQKREEAAECRRLWPFESFDRIE